jgi:hypothetical protein
LNTLNELATALGNDPNFATTVTNTLATKEPKFSVDSYSSKLTTTDENGESVITLHVDVSSKENVLTASEPTTGYKLLVSTEGTTNKFVRGLIAEAPLSITEQGEVSLRISSDTYDKQTVDDKLLSKPDALTAKEPEGGLPILRGTDVRGLKVEAPLGLINVGDDTLLLSADVYNKAEIDSKILQNIDDLDDALTGELALKADKVTTYTKTEVDGQLVLKQNTLTAGTVPGGYPTLHMTSFEALRQYRLRGLRSMSSIWNSV